MELYQVHEVKEVYSPEEASAAIQREDWKLLAVTAAHHRDPFKGDKLQTCYVLGKPKPPAEPKGKYVDGDWVSDRA